MPQNAFFPWTADLLVSQKTTQRHFFSTLHPLSPVIFATGTVVAFLVLFFNFHCCAKHEATPTQKLVRKWHYDLSWLLARKITKGIHSCKPASLNRLIMDRGVASSVILLLIYHCIIIIIKQNKEGLSFCSPSCHTLWWPQSQCSCPLPCLRQFWSKPSVSEGPHGRTVGVT